VRLGTRLVVLPLTLALCSLAVTGSAWATTSWLVRAGSNSAGESKGTSLPAAPAGVTATCAAPTTSATVTVGWTTVSHAASYSVYDSTTSANGTYTLVASGITSTSWTSGTLTASTNYWFEVVTTIGTHWSGSKSSASPESTMHSSNPFCVQP
jgi:cellulose 1,4-beta-cellobiosidase